ncbi:zingipain-2-like [Solanum stenotomum]|uniref:zingipain-2-like n=1 Tax=Solanum stenotomum TaxID=172797 RepID=UPI0020D07EC1|nr:zingipain-2-like [Solanum stenotomum]
MALVLAWKTQFTLLFVIFGMYASQVTCRNLQDSSSMLEKHESWMARHGRTYENDIEKAKRLNIFKKNVKFIESFNNNGSRSYKLGINKFSDLTSEEFLRYYTTNHGLNNKFSSIKSQKLSPTTISSFKYENMSDVPSEMDWRKSGVVTSIKDQGGCGCCWAFSTIAALEGANKLSTGKLISLSEQQLLDCSIENDGCNGGSMPTAYDYIVKNNGIAAESDYPYEENQDSCKIQDSIVKMSSYEMLPPSSEPTLLTAVARQPISVGIAVNKEFMSYQSGVYDGNCGDEVNHAVTIIGYGTNNENGAKYWIIKNSWGSSWGENGYMKIARDIGNNDGLCRIATMASYPIV